MDCFQAHTHKKKKNGKKKGGFGSQEKSRGWTTSLIQLCRNPIPSPPHTHTSTKSRDRSHNRFFFLFQRRVGQADLVKEKLEMWQNFSFVSKGLKVMLLLRRCCRCKQIRGKVFVCLGAKEEYFGEIFWAVAIRLYVVCFS